MDEDLCALCEQPLCNDPVVTLVQERGVDSQVPVRE